MSKKFDQKFKEDSVHYYLDHKDIGLQKAADNLGISRTALSTWYKQYRENEGTVPTIGSGNYASKEAEELSRLRRELRDTKDALNILKKAISILGN